jgi:hypothetical protein
MEAAWSSGGVRGLGGFGLAFLALAPPTGLLGQVAKLREVHRVSASEEALSVVAIVAGTSNTVWISQPQDGDIVVSRSGREGLVHIGGSGAGPGAFRRASQIYPRGDSVWVYDRDLRRGTWFDDQGHHAPTVPIREPAGLGAARPQAAGPNGRAWWAARTPQEGVYSARHDGGEVRFIGALPASNCSRMLSSPSKALAVAIPLCHLSKDAYSPGSEVLVVATPVRGGRDSAGVEVTVLGWRADTLLHRTIWTAASPIPESVRDSVVGVLRERYGGSSASGLTELLNGENIPREYSPLVGVRVSDAGSVAVTIREGPGGEIVLHLVQPGGGVTRRFLLPPDTEVRWLGGDGGIVAVEEDADGLQDVVLYSTTHRDSM